MHNYQIHVTLSIYVLYLHTQEMSSFHLQIITLKNSHFEFLPSMSQFWPVFRRMTHIYISTFSPVGSLSSNCLSVVYTLSSFRPHTHTMWHTHTHTHTVTHTRTRTYARTHTHWHTHIPILFEDRKPTGLKVDIAKPLHEPPLIIIFYGWLPGTSTPASLSTCVTLVSTKTGHSPLRESYSYFLIYFLSYVPDIVFSSFIWRNEFRHTYPTVSRCNAQTPLDLPVATARVFASAQYVQVNKNKTRGITQRRGRGRLLNHTPLRTPTISVMINDRGYILLEEEEEFTVDRFRALRDVRHSRNWMGNKKSTKQGS